jgi:arsenate reductase
MNVLFICLANSGRSQIAEGLARHHYASLATYQSAAVHSEPLSPYTIEVMDEVGIDVRRQFSKPITGIDLSSVNVAIVLCGLDRCPPLPTSVTVVSWPINDPDDAPHDRDSQLAAYRVTRTEITERLTDLPSVISAASNDRVVY